MKTRVGILLVIALLIAFSTTSVEAQGRPADRGKPTTGGEDIPRAPPRGRGGSSTPVDPCSQTRTWVDCAQVVNSLNDGSLRLECAPRAFRAVPATGSKLVPDQDATQIACKFSSFSSVRPFVDKCFTGNQTCDLLEQMRDMQDCQLRSRSLDLFERRWCRGGQPNPTRASDISMDRPCEDIKNDLKNLTDQLGADPSAIPPRLWPYLSAEEAGLIPPDTLFQKGITEEQFNTLDFGCSCECDRGNAGRRRNRRRHGDRTLCGTEGAEALIMTLYRSRHRSTIAKESLGNLWCCIPAGLKTELATSGSDSCSNLDDACQIPTRGRAASRIVEACRPQEPAHLWWMADVKKLGCLITTLDLDTVANISRHALCPPDYLVILAKCVRDACRPENAALLSIVVDKCVLLSSGSGVILDEYMVTKLLKGIGCAAATLPKEAMDKMPDTAFGDKGFRRGLEKGLERQPPARKWYMRKKYDDAGVPLVERLNSTPAMATINTREFTQDAPGDLPNRNLTGLSQAQQLALEESSDHPEFKDPEEVVKMAPRLPGTPSTAVMEEVVAKTTDPLGDFIKLAGGACAEDAQLPQLAILLRMGLAALDDVRPWSQLSKDVIQEILPCNVAVLTKLSAAALADVPDDTCRPACARIANLPTLRQHLPRSKGKALLDWCTNCTGASNRAQLSSWDVDQLGALLGFADRALIRRVGVEGILGSKAFRLRACILPEAWEGVKEVLSGFNSQDYCMDGMMIGEPSIAILIQLAQKVQTCSEEARREFMAAVYDALGRGEAGDEDCRAQLTEEERQTAEEDISPNTALLDLLGDAVNQGRRKRSVDLNRLTCADLQDLGQYVTQMTARQLSKLPPEALYACRLYLATIRGFSMQQVEEIANKIKQQVRDICQVPSDFLQALGPLVAGLSVQDINCLQHLDDDAIIAIGAKPIPDIRKLEALANRYMSLKSMVPGDINSDVIAFMGHVICGLTTDQISKIPPSQYSLASAVVGTLEWCPIERLEALAALAKHTLVYGPVSGWQMNFHSEAGIVIAGLSGPELASVSVHSVKVWAPHAITVIHHDKFKQLTEEQLSSFTLPQAQAVTRQQMEALCQNQADALQAVLEGNAYTLQGGACQAQPTRDPNTGTPGTGNSGTGTNGQGPTSSGPRIAASFWLSLVFIVVTRML